MSGSYGGKIDFESVLEYEKSGTYEPATKEHPAKNVPKPKKPAGADEKSLKGLHLSIAFAVAATQYAYNTGITPCWSKALCRNQNAITS